MVQDKTREPRPCHLAHCLPGGRLGGQLLRLEWGWKEWVGFLALLLLLRSFHLEGGAGWLGWIGWWADEGVWGEEARRWLLYSWRPGEDVGSLQGYYLGLLYTVVLLPIFSLFGMAHPYHRWVSLTFGVLSVPVLYLFLRRIGLEKKESIGISLLFAFSTGQLFFSRIARPDTMSQFLALSAVFLAVSPPYEFWGGMLLGLSIFFVKANYLSG